MKNKTSYTIEEAIDPDVYVLFKEPSFFSIFNFMENDGEDSNNRPYMKIGQGRTDRIYSKDAGLRLHDFNNDERFYVFKKSDLTENEFSMIMSKDQVTRQMAFYALLNKQD